jgi:hypothetical protein
MSSEPSCGRRGSGDGKTNGHHEVVLLAFVDGDNGGFFRTSAGSAEEASAGAVLWKAVGGRAFETFCSFTWRGGPRKNGASSLFIGNLVDKIASLRPLERGYAR